VNDLAVMGMKSLWFSLDVILKAGLSFQTLEKILQSIAKTANEAGVQIVCGDTTMNTLRTLGVLTSDPLPRIG